MNGKAGFTRRPGFLVAPALVLAVAGMAFGLISSTAGNPGLPAHVDIGRGVPLPSVAHASHPPLPTSSTSGAPPPTSVPVTAVPPAPPVTTGPNPARAAGGTTVLTVVPTVRVEDDNGRQVGDEGNELSRGSTAHEGSGDN